MWYAVGIDPLPDAIQPSWSGGEGWVVVISMLMIPSMLVIVVVVV